MARKRVKKSGTDSSSSPAHTSPSSTRENEIARDTPSPSKSSDDEAEQKGSRAPSGSKETKDGQKKKQTQTPAPDTDGGGVSRRQQLGEEMGPFKMFFLGIGVALVAMGVAFAVQVDWVQFYRALSLPAFGGEVVRPKIDKVFMRWDDGVKFRVNLFDNETWDSGRSFALVAGTTFRHVKMTRKEDQYVWQWHPVEVGKHEYNFDYGLQMGFGENVREIEAGAWVFHYTPSALFHKHIPLQKINLAVAYQPLKFEVDNQHIQVKQCKVSYNVRSMTVDCSFREAFFGSMTCGYRFDATKEYLWLWKRVRLPVSDIWITFQVHEEHNLGDTVDLNCFLAQGVLDINSTEFARHKMINFKKVDKYALFWDSANAPNWDAAATETPSKLDGAKLVGAAAAAAAAGGSA